MASFTPLLEETKNKICNISTKISQSLRLGHSLPITQSHKSDDKPVEVEVEGDTGQRLQFQGWTPGG